MGAGASAIPPSLDEAKAKELAGDHWDAAYFSTHAEEDFATCKAVVTKEQFLEAARAKGLSVGGEAAGSGGGSASGGGGGGAAGSDLLTKWQGTSEEDREEEAKLVLEAALRREAKRKAEADAAAKQANMDYSKGFSGSAEDTKKEKEAAAEMRGGAQAEDEDPRLVELQGGLTAAQKEAVEGLGKWLKLMGGSGCYVYVHSLTHEFAANRPEGFVDDGDLKAKEDAAGGLPVVELTDVVGEIKRIIEEEKKTPLLLDDSEDRKLATFFSFKGVLVDGTKLALPLRNKARPKPKAFMEELRTKAVQAMKGGQTLCLDLGESEGSKAAFWSTLCKPDGVRKELFIEGGKGLTRNKMAYTKMWKDEEKEHGSACPRDDFQFVVVTALSPKEYEKELFDDAVPKEHAYPVVVASD